MTLTTRKPSGLPTWPITLLAGMQSAGKSFTAAEASASPLVSRCLWISYGERDPDELAAIPGANFEIVEHDGTVHGVIEKLQEISRLEVPEEGPILTVLDSASPFWGTISDNVQVAAAARKRDRPASADPADNIDLWQPAKADWQAMLDALRAHKGPSIITARFEESSVVVDGKVTDRKEWRVKAEKGLPYDVDAVIEIKSRGDYRLTKVRSALSPFTEPHDWPDFTMDALWRQLGLTGPTGAASYTKPVTDAAAAPSRDKSGRDWLAELDKARTLAAVTKLGGEAIAARAGEDVQRAIRRKHATLSPVQAA